MVALAALSETLADHGAVTRLLSLELFAKAGDMYLRLREVEKNGDVRGYLILGLNCENRCEFIATLNGS